MNAAQVRRKIDRICGCCSALGKLHQLFGRRDVYFMCDTPLIPESGLILPSFSPPLSPSPPPRRFFSLMDQSTVWGAFLPRLMANPRNLAVALGFDNARCGLQGPVQLAGVVPWRLG